jgi:hypothetical protein
LRLLVAVDLAVQRAEAEVAVGHERTHAQLVGEGERLSVVVFRVFGAAYRPDLTREAQSMGLASLPSSCGPDAAPPTIRL